MLENILVPLDGSEIAAKALDYVAKVAGPKASVTLLMVIDPPEDPAYSGMLIGPGGASPTPMPSFGVDYQSLTEEMMAQARHYLNHVAEDLRKGGYNVEIEVTLGNPAPLIVETAEKLHSDTILMSTHGRSGLSRWLLGSIAHKVLSSAPCPVYVIPPARRED
jgi:nucleotide-binding universal stress UspA family protein